MSAPKRLINSKPLCPFESFLFEFNYHHNGIEDKNKKNSIRSKNHPKSKTLRELERVDID